MIKTDVIIVGASFSGLGCAACLQKSGLKYIILERQSMVGAPWRNHYERLHLHTTKSNSNLPYKKFNASVPRYPSRNEVVEYLESYQKTFNITPVLNTEVSSIKKEKNDWVIHTNNGNYTSHYVIIATGPFGKPNTIHINGMESFTGKLLHSCSYKTGKDYKGQRVLIVGFGNSACEIALDLYEQGAMPFMSVRSPVNVIPRDVLGIPILQLSLLMSHLSARFADSVVVPLMKNLTGDITKLGLQKLPYGPLQQIRKYGKAPVIDIGTIMHIRKRHIGIYGGINYINNKTVHFVNGQQADFDAIITATGYQWNFESFIEVDKRRTNDLRLPVDEQKYFGEDGLYFCGFWISPTGQIREIAKDARKIAKDILRKNRKTTF